MPPAPTYYNRHGAEVKPHSHNDARGTGMYAYTKTCTRCGGAGGAQQWAHTGWTCYQCGGQGNLGVRLAPCYTADKLARLNAAAAKRAAKREAARLAKEAAARAEAEARRAAFRAAHGALLDRAAAYAECSAFIRDVLDRANDRAVLTDAQAAALVKSIDRLDADDAKRAASQYVGAVGERVTFTATVEKILSGESPNNPWARYWYISLLRTADGSVVKYMGHIDGGQGDTLTVRATVKAHELYNGEKQTIIARPRVIQSTNGDK